MIGRQNGINKNWIWVCW